MSVRLAAPVLAACLAACASGGPAPKADPVDLTSGAERAAYWLDRDPFSAGILARSYCESGAVTAEYTIGSNGRVYDVRIVQSRPRAPATEAAMREHLMDRRFDPGPENLERRAARVREEFHVHCGGVAPPRR